MYEKRLILCYHPPRVWVHGWMWPEEGEEITLHSRAQHHANTTPEWKATREMQWDGMGVATTREIIASSPHLALPREGEEQKREGRSIGIGGDDEQTA